MLEQDAGMGVSGFSDGVWDCFGGISTELESLLQLWEAFFEGMCTISKESRGSKYGVMVQL